jgi:hypothetical protein
MMAVGVTELDEAIYVIADGVLAPRRVPTSPPPHALRMAVVTRPKAKIPIPERTVAEEVMDVCMVMGIS